MTATTDVVILLKSIYALRMVDAICATVSRISSSRTMYPTSEASSDPLGESRGGFGAAQKVPLDQVAAELAQPIQGGLVFDALGHDEHAQTMAETDRRRDDRLVTLVGDQVAH